MPNNRLQRGRGYRRAPVDAAVNQGDSDEMRRLVSSKGRPEGVAGLDANAQVPEAQMGPSRFPRLFLLMGA